MTVFSFPVEFAFQLLRSPSLLNLLNAFFTQFSHNLETWTSNVWWNPCSSFRKSAFLAGFVAIFFSWFFPPDLLLVSYFLIRLLLRDLKKKVIAKNDIIISYGSRCEYEIQCSSYYCLKDQFSSKIIRFVFDFCWTLLICFVYVDNKFVSVYWNFLILFASMPKNDDIFFSVIFIIIFPVQYFASQ